MLVRLNILFYSVLKILKKAYRVILSSKVSDHWKEKMVPYYALSIIRISSSILFVLGSIVVIFFLPSKFSITFIDYVVSYEGIIESLALSIIYIKIRHFYFE